MKTGIFAAILFALIAVFPAQAQEQAPTAPQGEVIDRYGQWILSLYPRIGLCSLVAVYPTESGEPAIVQLLAVGEQFTLQIRDPLFPYEVGQEFGTVIETEEKSTYVRMEVEETFQGEPFLTSKMDVDPAAGLFVQLAWADSMTLKYQKDSYQYELQGLDRAARGFLQCNAYTLQN
jgi:hypothetical protein